MMCSESGQHRNRPVSVFEQVLCDLDHWKLLWLHELHTLQSGLWETYSVPGGSSRQLGLLQQHHVLHASFGQVIGHADPHTSTTDDDGVRGVLPPFPQNCGSITEGGEAQVSDHSCSVSTGFTAAVSPAARPRASGSPVWQDARPPEVDWLQLQLLCMRSGCVDQPAAQLYAQIYARQTHRRLISQWDAATLAACLMNPESRTHLCSARRLDVQQMVLKGSRAIVRQADDSLRSWTLMRFNIRDMTTIKKQTNYKLTTHATPSTRWPPVTDPAPPCVVTNIPVLHAHRSKDRNFTRYNREPVNSLCARTPNVGQHAADREPVCSVKGAICCFTEFLYLLYQRGSNTNCFHQWINKLLLEENKVPEQRWQGPPHVNKVMRYEAVN